MAMASAVDISNVLELSVEAQHLMVQCHYARAERKYAKAVEAAQKLGQPDCLVVARLQLQQCSMARNAADAGAVPEKIPLLLLLSACKTLQRRFAAGTLLDGACRSHEEELHEALVVRCALEPAPDSLLAMCVAARILSLWRAHALSPSLSLGGAACAHVTQRVVILSQRQAPGGLRRAYQCRQASLVVQHLFLCGNATCGQVVQAAGGAGL